MISDESSSSSKEYPVERVDSLEQWYDLGRTIGRGEFAKVKVARCRSSKKMVPGGTAKSRHPYRWP